MEIPTEFHGLLSSRAVAIVGTIGKHGEPQVTPIWFLLTMPTLAIWLLVMCFTRAASDAAGATTADP